MKKLIKHWFPSLIIFVIIFGFFLGLLVFGQCGSQVNCSTDWWGSAIFFAFLMSILFSYVLISCIKDVFRVNKNEKLGFFSFDKEVFLHLLLYLIIALLIVGAFVVHPLLGVIIFLICLFLYMNGN